MKTHPISIIRTEKAKGGLWRVVERETTAHGIKPGDPIVVIHTHWLYSAVYFAQLMRMKL